MLNALLFQSLLVQKCYGPDILARVPNAVLTLVSQQEMSSVSRKRVRFGAIHKLKVNAKSAVLH